VSEPLEKPLVSPHPSRAGYSAPVGSPRNGPGIASLVFGVLGLITSLFSVGILFGLFAVVFGFTAEVLVMRGEASNRGLAVAGMVLGIVAILVGLAAWAYAIWIHA
jgi:uncharacterized membrane protein